MVEAQHVWPPSVNFREDAPREAQLAALAEGQHGVVTLGQLEALGLSTSAVSRRAACGRLHRVHRGVFALGRPGLGAHGRWMAAALAYAPRGSVSHRSSSELLGLRQGASRVIDITVAGPTARERPGFRVHRSITLTVADVTVVAGIPCTGVARTLVDLGDVADRREVERAVDQAETLGLFDLSAVEEALERAGPRRGARVLRALLSDLAGPTPTLSELEERFLALIRAASLPAPEVNAWLVLDDGPAIKADFLWRVEGLIVEVDGHAYHSSRRAFERDRYRDQRLALAGFRVVRFTHHQLVQSPRRAVEVVRELLARLARP